MSSIATAQPFLTTMTSQRAPIIVRKALIGNSTIRLHALWLDLNQRPSDSVGCSTN